ncbi:Protein FAR1-RELATED SEQUENCE 5 [Quillaja saponaria]|uniref:Protein FAR1-RELATED SEQUENCE 5 n=1 Tax=Quillaja saponaria TaxID=32244 RepID=A0AAD7LTJ0_QUISA|nr:Protein FAR1-RELATED SEQUENCE 5 [Quillaja saponaria]
MSGHPSCRRFSEEEIVRIKDMNKAGIAPRQILSSLRQNNPNLLAVSRTLYNVKAKIRKDSLGGRTMIQALMDELDENGFKYSVEHDCEGHLTHLFFTYPISIALTKSYSTVFVMDCTYKTNKYKMPLLDIIGVSSFNSCFYSCFAFLQKEGEKDYIWALSMFRNLLGVSCQPSVIVCDKEFTLINAIKVVFPSTTNLLCVWHIEKNIVAKCKSHFEEGEDWDTFLSNWTCVRNSVSESKYHEALQYFESRYKEKGVLLNYIRSTWLPLKELFVVAWIEKCIHFGNHATSRAEGAHGILKKYLQVSTGDLSMVKDRICLAIKNQFQEIKAQLSSEKINVPRHFKIPLFKDLVTYVSVFALEELFKQYKKSKFDIELLACKGHFSATMGLPCSHKIRSLESEVLDLVDINQQWRLDMRSFSEYET